MEMWFLIVALASGPSGISSQAVQVRTLVACQEALKELTRSICINPLDGRIIKGSEAHRGIYSSKWDAPS